MSQKNFKDQPQTLDSTPFEQAGETQTLPKSGVLLSYAEQPALIGLVLNNRYKVESKLGDGGFGTVFLASDQRLMNKQVVVKVLERSDNEWVWTKFQQEREALSRIEHPGVVGIQDAGDLPNGQAFIVIQFINGTTLREEMNKSTLTVRRTIDTTEQIAYALAAAHEKGILHRDLKPENIMFQPLTGKREQIKVIDFGIAKVKQSQVSESSTGLFSAGTLLYMPPEVLQGNGYTIASEVYVMAVLVYEMLTGKRPFCPKTDNSLLFPAELLEMQQHDADKITAALPAELSPKGREILLKALSFEPAKRFQTPVEFADEFAEGAASNATTTPAAVATVAFSPTGPVAAPVTPPPPPISIPANFAKTRPKNNKPLLIGAALASLLLIVGLTAGGIWFANRSQPDKPAANESVISPIAQSGLQFWLNVQKMRDGKPFQEPFKSSGQEIFENGYKFQLNAKSSQKGYFYLFNENADRQKNGFSILFPTPKRNNGSAQVNANESVETGWNIFSGEGGTEKCWLIWTEEQNPALETARQTAFDNGGAVTGEQSETLRKFITDNNTSAGNISKDAQNKLTNIKIPGKISVSLLELEHQ